MAKYRVTVSQIDDSAENSYDRGKDIYQQYIESDESPVVGIIKAVNSI